MRGGHHNPKRVHSWVQTARNPNARIERPQWSGGRHSRKISGLKMGGYEVSSAKSMGTEYTFLAAKCFVNGAVQPAQVKVEDEMITEVQVMSEAQYAAALASASKFVLPIGPGKSCLCILYS